ncbi:hypothetical protein LCGC14_0577920 [marine sediment metagenome]|uniref:Uncharacterized protein n=1 Tax=marine sediment metagenome TaxID=412755 RepID=A0A0F9U3J4_9ZZZZ
MPDPIKRKEYLRIFQSLQNNEIRFQTPLILRMYGELNKVNMRNENRYILCNFLDQNSDKIGLGDDIYKINNQKTLNQLLLLAVNKAKEFKLLEELYEEYISSIGAINKKKLIKT